MSTGISTPPSQDPSKHSNLLLITSDQQHYLAMGARSRHIKTPNLDRLAARGIDFTRAYCPNPTCTPTRASLITGMWPSCHGAYSLGTRLDENVPVIGDVLRKQGYVSGLIGKAHFQPMIGTPDYPTIEGLPTVRDLDFWRSFNEKHTPWYGFDHVEIARMHGDEPTVGQHYAIWMEEQGLANWRDYFQVTHNPKLDSPTAGKLAPPPMPDAPCFGYRTDMHWKLPAELHYTTWTGQRTNAFITEQHAAGKPWFCWSSYHDPHPPYVVPEPWASMYDPADMDWLIGDFVEGEFERMPRPHQLTRQRGASFREFFEVEHAIQGFHCHLGVSKQLWRQTAAIYCGMVSFMDQQIGATLDLLDRTGQTDNTLVIFTSDHGHFLGQHGFVSKGPFHYEDMIRVPMIASGPGLPAGKRNDVPQTLVDLPATFAAASGAGVPMWMQGRDMRSAWSEGGGRPAVIVENHHNGAAVHLRTVVTATHKLTIYRARPEWGELFDLERDPHELNNLYHREPVLRAKLMEQLVQADLEREPTPQQRVSGA